MKIINKGLILLCTGSLRKSGQKLQLLPLVIPSRNHTKSTKTPIFYQNPIFSKQDQALIDKDELSKLAAVPVKAAGPDETSSVYYDPLVRKVVRHIMKDGNKELARSLLEKSFEVIKRMQIERYHLASPENKSKIILNPREVLHMAIENSKPILNLLPAKRGGITYQVPGPITESKALFMAIKWLIETTKEKERTVHFPEQFAREIIDASNNKGKVVKKKQELHRQCEANRAYAHYRWK